jgi:hypothetical protein
VNSEIKEDEKEKKGWKTERESNIVVGRRKMMMG